jgi:hypothetical protein
MRAQEWTWTEGTTNAPSAPARRPTSTSSAAGGQHDGSQSVLLDDLANDA